MKRDFQLAVVLGLVSICVVGCKAGSTETAGASGQPPFMSTMATAPPQVADDTLPPEQTGGFDGKKAFAQVAKQVSFGPRPAGSKAIAQLQDYLQSELKSYGCTVETDNFRADTPAGRLPMKNILVKIPGEKPGIILLGTHYDTKRLENFVGADDAGSSTAVMLELARLLCQKHSKYAVWIAFFDAEEAVNWEWKDPDNCYGSRQMAARMAASGDLPKVKAFLLADIVGGRKPHFKRESYSTKWLVDLVWATAKRLGYGNIFVDDPSQVEDDHQSFLRRNVPSVDVIDLDNGPDGDVYYWHTPQDSLDKISAKTLGIVGHVFLESVKQLQSR
ncbi:MAG TPA: M28 family peptidase [Candidatus Acidoferrum sp.]|nr:M28 family peptidase [Candidatus Acidoferrum sp.]